ncbi:antirestriction protein ArdA [Dyadobacter sp. 22481]|uniref:antirestriction protein ArdA n=1 Tax=Dyadobacter sp. 22481 TaxID=3453926 RepID=UPI003F845AF1
MTVASPSDYLPRQLTCRFLKRLIGLLPGGRSPRHFFFDCKAAIALSTKLGPPPPGGCSLKSLSIMKNLENAPRIYVGTYGQYNSGSLFGKWFDLTDYGNSKQFFEACYEYHRDEIDGDGCRPELMFRDWENIPDFLISECSLDENTFEYFDALGELDEKTAEAFGIYCDQINRWPQNSDEIQDQLESFRESYQGYLEILRMGPAWHIPTNTWKIPGYFPECRHNWKDILTMSLSHETCLSTVTANMKVISSVTIKFNGVTKCFGSICNAIFYFLTSR